MKKIIFFSFTVVLLLFNGYSEVKAQNADIKVGAEQFKKYLPLLKGKKVALLTNHTAVIDGVHLVDTLLHLGVDIKCIFSPEHGFRGQADAGGKVKDGVDKSTGLPIYSLYGKHKKPSKEQLKGVDVLVFDIQDVGVRFYTYISSMHLAMEACAENNIHFLVLDRPNPNGYYVDGAILDKKYQSFIGMHPIPIVHGLTVAELALMINGEHWLKDSLQCDLHYVPCYNYTHHTFYRLPIKPSPNLPTQLSIYAYPTLGLLEGTVISIGRGTEKPFQYVAHPEFKNPKIEITPVSRSGAKHPKFENQLCKGLDLEEQGEEHIRDQKQIDLDLILLAYRSVPHEKFYRSSFNLLAGTDSLKYQINHHWTAKNIRKSWQKGLEKYKKLRQQYLIYKE